jgi:hypothetical protein
MQGTLTEATEYTEVDHGSSACLSFSKFLSVSSVNSVSKISGALLRREDCFSNISYLHFP